MIGLQDIAGGRDQVVKAMSKCFKVELDLLALITWSKRLSLHHAFEKSLRKVILMTSDDAHIIRG